MNGKAASGTDALRWPWLAACGLLVLSALALRWFPDDSPIPGRVFLRQDEEHYADLVRQLLHGRFSTDYFINPTLYAYLLAAVTAAVGGLRVLLGLDESFALFVGMETLEPRTILVAGRILSMVAGALSVAVVARIGRRLFDARVGFLAALALAVDWIAVQRAGLAGNESLMVLLVLLAVDAAVTARDAAGWRARLGCGLLLGLATATKYSAGIFVLPVIVALGRRAPLALLGAAGGFLLGSWSVLLAPRAFLEGFSTQAAFLHGGFRETESARTGSGWWVYLREFPDHHQGLAFALLGVLGLAASLLLAMRRQRDHRLLVACVLPLYLFLGSGRFVSPRFLLPVVPFLLLLAAWALTRISDSAVTKRWLPLLIGVALLLPAAPRSAADMRATHQSVDPLGPFCRFVTSRLEPADRVVEYSYPSRNRLFADANPWRRLGIARPAPDRLRQAEERLAAEGAPPRTTDLVDDLLVACATLDQLRARLRDDGFTALVLQMPTALARDPRLAQTTVPNPALRDCTYWGELFAWLATLPIEGPLLSADGSMLVSLVRLPAP